MKIDSMKKLFLHELKDIYSAENQLLKALPKLEEAAGAPELKEVFRMHRSETEGHVKRLDQIFEQLGSSSSGPKCKGMEGLISEGADLIKEKADMDPEVLDAGLIASAQKCEHYEITTYGTLRAFANQLGHQQAAQLFGQTLDEEYAADKLLSKLAEGWMNAEAVQQGTKK